MKPSTLKGKILKAVIAAVFWIAIWELAALAVNKEILVAAPDRVLVRLWELGGTVKFWTSALMSLGRIITGFLLAVVLGSLTACITAKFGLADTLFSPLVAVIKATPVASFIILALVWLDKGNIPSFTSFLMTFPVIWGNCHQGIKQVNTELTEVADVYGVSRGRKFKILYVPSVLPYFTSACTTGLGLAWKAGIAAEVLCTPEQSIGRELYNAKIYLETADVFAWTLVVILFSFIIEKLLVYFIRKGLPQRGIRTA